MSIGGKGFLVKPGDVDPDIVGLSRLALFVFVVTTVAVWYYYARFTDEEIKLGANAPTLAAVALNTDPLTDALKQQGTSDEVGNIESDLNATNLNDLDRELDGINAALR